MNSRDRKAAFRHLVYETLLGGLPPASCEQTENFIANLALTRTGEWQSSRDLEREIWKARQRLLYLKVSPDIGRIKLAGRIFSLPEIETVMRHRFGNALAEVPGFYSTRGGEFRLNLPERCFLFGYRNSDGFYNGILCQPINQQDFFFLLSSAKFGGPKAARLEPEDTRFFDRFHHRPVPYPVYLQNLAASQVAAQ